MLKLSPLTFRGDMPLFDTVKEASDNATIVQLEDPSGTVQAVKAASTAAAAADPSAVVALSPNSPIPTGTNSIGTVKAQLQDNSGTAITLGQKTMASSVPAVLASDQTGINSFLDKNATGSLTALNQTVSVATNGMGVAMIQAAGTFTATATFEASEDNGSTWFTVVGTNIGASGAAVSGFTSTGNFAVDVGGFTNFRVRISAFTSGTVNVVVNTGSGFGGGFASKAFRIADSVGNIIPSTLINSKQRLDVNLASDGTDGAAVPFQTSLVGGSDGTNLQALLTATDGRLIIILSDSNKATYSASITGLAAALTPTDVFTLTGSATKTIRVISIEFSGTQTTSAVRDVLLLKRSTANTAGTSTTLTNVPHDSTDAAATATVRAYTANPTLGTLVGQISSKKVDLEATNLVGAADSQTWVFGEGPIKAIVLRGTSEVFAVNLNSVTSAGNSLNINIEWTEE